MAATVQVAEVVARGGLTSTAAVQVAEVRAVGGLSSSRTVQVAEVRAVGGVQSAPVVLQPIASVTIEPTTAGTLTAVPAAGSAVPDSYSWRVVSGPAMPLTVAGATVTFTTPAPLPPNASDIVLGVTAVRGDTSSAEVTTTVTVPPQLSWYWDGTRWVAMRQSILT